MDRYYQIGGKDILVSGESLCTELDGMQSINTFRVDAPLTDNAYLFVETKEEAHCFEKIIYRLKDLDTTFLFGKTNEGYRLQQTMDDGRIVELWTHNGNRQMHIAGEWEPRMTRYALWMGFGIQGLQDGKLMLHGSCIVKDGEAVLFLGESGTGKSTHTRLWREHIAQSQLLNDDGPIISVEKDGKVWIYGSPWSGKTPCYRSERYPLKACVRLSQAPTNEIKHLSVLQAYAALHPSCPAAFAYDRVLYDMQSATLGRVLESVPCYHLACLPNAEAAKLSYHTLFG